ncbi:MAG: SusC/RagA family TonB-linked outer membrane protein [Tannerella sp.]|nr:SusC/RagA family TonB-linked outer membrane protein [Tannerella sp.]
MKFLIVGLFSTFCFMAAQTQNVTGLVVDETGEPVVGTSVLVKGTQTGTSTDVTGRFSIAATEGQTLVFSMIGMYTVEQKAQQGMRVVIRHDEQMLDEVVVTALGITKSEKNLSYAASTINSEEVTRAGQRSALNALQGKVAGVSITSNSGAPGASSRIVLRGYSSIEGNNEPLFVVDGVPISNNALQATALYNPVDFGNAINDINPNDIENVTILKGAAASALYGSRAANGVILITTKSGSAQEKLQIDYSGSVKFTNYMPVLKYQTDYGQGWSGHFAYDENGSWGPKFDGKDRLWGRIINGQQQYKPFVGQPSSIQDFYQTGLTYSNTVSISGGNSATTYYVSYSNMSDDGIVPTDVDSYSRNTFNFNGSHKSKYMTISSNITYNQKAVSAVGGGQGYSVFNNIMQIPRDFSIVDMADYKSPFYDINGYYTQYGIVNPYWTLNEDGNEYNEDHVYGNLKVEIPIYKTLKFTARLGEDFYSNRTKQWTAIINPDEWSQNYGNTSDPGWVYVRNGYRNEVNLDAFLTFESKFNDFSLNGLLGYNINSQYSNSHYTEVTGLDLPGFYSVRNTSSTPTVSQTYTQRRLTGMYGQFDFIYKDMLYLNVGARNDWSSTLPKEGNSYFYPAAGISWLASETFPAVKSILSFGKLRANYGVTGNDPSAYVLKSVMVSAMVDMPFGGDVTFPFGGLNAYEVSNTIGNASLRPEMTREVELGADLRFVNNRIAVDFAWYKRNTKDQIMPVSIPTSTGYSSAYMNLGDVQNKGVEVQLKFIPVKTADLTWDIGITYAKNENLVLEMLDDVLEEIQIGGFSGSGIWAAEGKPMGYFRTTGVRKTDDGKIIVSANGLPIATSGEEEYGSFQHDYTMGFTTQVNYKGIYLAAAFDYRKGGLFFSRTANINDFVGNNIRTAYNDRRPFVVPNSVRETRNDDGDIIYVENTTPIAIQNINTFYNNGGLEGEASSLIDKTSFRAREIVLGYSLPGALYKNTPISNIDISLIGYNMLLWLPKSNTFIDPDVTTFGNTIESEFGEFSSYPATRSWGFSLKVSL